MSIVSWQMFESEGAACPSITLGSIMGVQKYVGDQFGNGAIVTGGTAPYTFSVTSGALPDGAVLNQLEVSPGVFAWYLTGTATTFGSFTFSIGGTDANGCAITPRSYTIEVWQEFTVNAGAVVLSDETLIPVSGLPAVYGTGVALSHITLNVTSGGINQAPTLDSPLYSGEASIAGGLLDGDIVDAVIYNSGTGFSLMSSGTTPFTGNWSSSQNYNTEFSGNDTNGDWIIYGLEGNLIVKLTFKPI